VTKPRTRLEAFILANKIDPALLAREACMKRSSLDRLIAGENPDLGVFTILRIRDACGRLMWRYPGIKELFEV
jgi:hypothetical protein